MATTIKLKNGSGAPLAGDLVQGEPAFDLTNKRLYTEDSGGTVIEVGTNPTSLTTGTFTSTGIDDNATSTAITIDSSQNVVLGNTSTSFDFEIYRSGASSQLAITGGNASVSDLLMGDTDDNNIQRIRSDHSDNSLQFQVNNSERMRIDSSGNVGIGTASPDALLHLQSSTNAQIRFSDADDPLNNFVGLLTGSDTLYIACDEDSASSNSRIGFRIDGTEHMRIDTGGNVGIGTTSPSYLVDAYGAVASRGSGIGNAAFVLQEVGNNPWYLTQFTSGPFGILYNGTSSANTKLIIDTSGNVGIGTASPSAFGTLAVKSTGTQLALTATTGSATMLFDENGTDRFFIKSLNGSDGLAFVDADGSTERMRIDASGNVGIGTTNPNPYGIGAGRIVTSYSTSGNLYGLFTAVGAGASGGGEIDFGNQSVRQAAIASLAGSHLGFYTNSTNTGVSVTERMRIDSSGNLLVGKTSTDNTTNGFVLDANGTLNVVRSSEYLMRLNRTSTDGEILRFQKDGTSVGSIGSEGGDSLFILNGDTGLRFSGGSDSILPCTTDGAVRDDGIHLGTASARFEDIYATNGTIQTSDANDKQDIEALSETETRVAVAAKGLLRKFRWKSAVEEKGDDARIHFGIIAQDLQAAFEAEGLDAGRYGMFIHSTWTDEETGEERSRMGVRYSELLAFIIAAI
jgi:hypothetical protein